MFQNKFSGKPKKKKRCPQTITCPAKQSYCSESYSHTPTKKSTTSSGTVNEKPKEQKGFMDNCKGFLRDVCGVFCPGKYKSKKKADSVIRYHSMPSMTQGRIGTFCLLLMSLSSYHIHFMVPYFFVNCCFRKTMAMLA